MQQAGPWKAIFTEVHIFYFEPPKQAELTQLLRYMKPVKWQTVGEQQGPPVCGREGELGGERDEEAGGSNDPSEELGCRSASQHQDQGWGQRSGSDTA